MQEGHHELLHIVYILFKSGQPDKTHTVQMRITAVPSLEVHRGGGRVKIDS